MQYQCRIMGHQVEECNFGSECTPYRPGQTKYHHKTRTNCLPA